MVDSERTWRGVRRRAPDGGLADLGVHVTLRRRPAGTIPAHHVAPIARVLRPRPARVRSLWRAMQSGDFDVVHSHAARAHGVVSFARVGLAVRPWHVVSRRVDFALGRDPVSAWKYRRGADAFIAI
jgi:hypothetical protein